MILENICLWIRKISLQIIPIIQQKCWRAIQYTRRVVLHSEYQNEYYCSSLASQSCNMYSHASTTSSHIRREVICGKGTDSIVWIILWTLFLYQGLYMLLCYFINKCYTIFFTFFHTHLNRKENPIRNLLSSLITETCIHLVLMGQLYICAYMMFLFTYISG